MTEKNASNDSGGTLGETPEPESTGDGGKKGSPKTTVAGVMALIATIGVVVVALADGDPETTVTTEMIGAVIAAGAVAFALWQARDHGTSSKAAGLDGD